MRKFRYVPHTADVAFVAYGRSLKEAVENAALAMLNVMLDVRKISKDRSASRYAAIKGKASDTTSLVWYVLQDILSAIDEKKLNAYRFKVSQLKIARRGNMASKLSGRLAFKDSNEDFSLLEVKAVTPHDLHVLHRHGRWSVRVLLDV